MIIGIILAILIISTLVLYVTKKTLVTRAEIDIINIITDVSNDKNFDMAKYESSINKLLPSVIKKYDAIISDVESLTVRYRSLKSTDLNSINNIKTELTNRLKSIEFKLDNSWILKFLMLK